MWLQRAKRGPVGRTFQEAGKNSKEEALSDNQSQLVLSELSQGARGEASRVQSPVWSLWGR